MKKKAPKRQANSMVEFLLRNSENWEKKLDHKVEDLQDIAKEDKDHVIDVNGGQSEDDDLGSLDNEDDDDELTIGTKDIASGCVH